MSSAGGTTASPEQDNSVQKVMPSLFGGGYGTYQARPENFLLSFVTHTVGLFLILWLVRVAGPLVKSPVVDKPFDLTTVYRLKVGTTGPTGGSGGDHSKLRASKGALPKASKMQFAPPQVLQPQQSKLMVQPTVVADLNIPQSKQMGDPLSSLTTLSGGPGVGSGIGNGSGGGVGSGSGPGFGAGICCGNGVTEPKALYTPDPEFSEEARKAKYQGTVELEVTIGADGRIHSARVVRSLGMGLDEKAIEGVKTWKFEPAKKDGRPIAVLMNVDVDFRLY